jgi:hypothetical protein
MTQNKINIVIFSPQKNIPGGSLILFARIAKILINMNKHLITIIDFEDGYINNFLKDSNYNFIPFENTTNITLNDNDILITSPNHLRLVNDVFHFKNNTRLFFWELGPYSLIQNLILGDLYRKWRLNVAKIVSNILEKKQKQLFNQFIQLATHTNGFFFMCGKNFYYNKNFFKCKIEPKYIPIPVICPDRNSKQNLQKNNKQKVIGIAWLSRLTKAKSIPLYKLISELNTNKIFNQYTIKLYIIGIGDEKENLEKFTSNLSFEIIFVNRIEHNKLDNFLLKNVDIGFGMGTSILEIAKLGIPSVLTTGEKTLFDDANRVDSYKWLFNTQDYNLSSEPSLSTNKSLLTIEQVFNDFNEIKNELSKMCYLYVFNSHNIETVYKKILLEISLNTFTYEKYMKLNIFQYSVISKILKGYKSLRSELKKYKSLKSIFNDKMNFYFWRIKNTSKPFHSYYIAQVLKNLKKQQLHPTLGQNIKDQERFNITGEIEKKFLISQGLLPHHKFVDYGCGSLRLGKVLIPYLDKSNYIGIDMTDAFYSEGKKHINNDILKLKQPVLSVINKNSLYEIKKLGIDYLMSAAVLYHIPYNELGDYFSNILSILKPTGKAFIDFTDGEKIKKNAWANWIYPSTVLQSIIKEKNGNARFYNLGDDNGDWYPEHHKIIEITHNL